MITGWGFTPQYIQIHYFDEETGKPICSQVTTNPKKKRKSQATMALHDWNPDNPSTCPDCRKMYLIKKEEMRGIERKGEMKEKAENTP